MAITYATLDPVGISAAFTLSNGDLTAAYSGGSWSLCRATIGKEISEGGVWYWEHIVELIGPASSQLHGLANADAQLGEFGHGWCGMTNDSVGIRPNKEFYSGSESGIVFGTPVTNDIIGHELDLDSNTYRQAINNVWQGYVTRGFPATIAGNYSGTPDLIYPAISFHGNQKITVNFGQSAFVYTPPSGANAGWFEGTAAAGRRRRMLLRSN